MSRLSDLRAVLEAEYWVSLVRTASIGGTGTWALDQAPRGKGFPEALSWAGERSVLARVAEVETPFTAVPTIKILDVGGLPVIRIPMHGWRFPHPSSEAILAVFWLLSQLGVEQVIVDASAGGIRAKPWDVVIPDDIVVDIDAKVTVTRLATQLGRGPWARMATPFCPRLRRALASSLRGLEQESIRLSQHPLGRLIEGGLYCTTPLSNFETAAEIRRFKRLGAVVVGQALGLETAAARLCGICVAVICPVSNFAEGLGEGEWIAGGMEAFFERCAMPMGLVTYRTLQEIVAQARECECLSIADRGLLPGQSWIQPFDQARG